MCMYSVVYVILCHCDEEVGQLFEIYLCRFAEN